MARRQVVNKTGISRIPNIRAHDVWVGFVCINCKSDNHLSIGGAMTTPEVAYQTAQWTCQQCGFIHSKDTDIPFPNWEQDDFKSSESVVTQRFWQGFFRIATEHKNSYWKQCNACGRILPYAAFSHHVGYGALECQVECRSCKGAINAVTNPKRTQQQHQEAAARRRVAELLAESVDEPVDIDDLFTRFGGRCFKTGVELDRDTRDSWAIDHILPSRWLYPLSKKNAALLSKDANNNKRDQWPSEFYTGPQLLELARITGADLTLLNSQAPIINDQIDANKCVERYLAKRQDSKNLAKRVGELRTILTSYNLVDKLSPENQALLGFTTNSTLDTGAM